MTTTCEDALRVRWVQNLPDKVRDQELGADRSTRGEETRKKLHPVRSGRVIFSEEREESGGQQTNTSASSNDGDKAPSASFGLLRPSECPVRRHHQQKEQNPAEEDPKGEGGQRQHHRGPRSRRRPGEDHPGPGSAARRVPARHL